MSESSKSSPPKPTPVRFIGCDVGKALIVVHEAGTGATRTITHRKADLEAFAAGLDADCLVVCEATGGHEALLLDVLLASGVAAHRADARKVKAFIRSYGTLGKSDDIDARHLSLYARERHASLLRWQMPDPDRQKLQALVLARQDMIADRTAWSNRSKAPGAIHAQPHFKAIIKALDKQISAAELAITTLIDGTRTLRQATRALADIKGIGTTTAATLIALMPELGKLDRRKAAALAGLAPHPKQSGANDAYRRTRGGRPQVKKALFMAALSASRSNPLLRQTYERMINAGKRPLVALTAIMRKLVVIANAKLRDIPHPI